MKKLKTKMKESQIGSLDKAVTRNMKNITKTII